MNTLGNRFASLVCAVLVLHGCCSPRAPETLDELVASYNAARKEANSVPTAAGAVERAITVWVERDIDFEACLALPETNKEVDVGGGKSKGTGRLFVRMKRPSAPVPDQLKGTVRANRAAFAELRKAQGLPPGMPPLEYQQPGAETVTPCPFLAKSRSLGDLLMLAVRVELGEGNTTLAKELVQDCLTVDKALHNGTTVVSLVMRQAPMVFANISALNVALNGDCSPSELEALAADLESIPEPSHVDIIRAMTFDRALALKWIALIEKWSDERLDELIQANSANYARDPVIAKATVQSVRAALAVNRAKLLDAYARLMQVLRSRGQRVREEPSEEDRYFVVLWHPAATARATQDRTLGGVARRRATVSLLRSFAFFRRAKRAPQATELKLPDDPFRPGQKMVYKYDKKNGRIGVYSRGWPEKYRRPEDPTMIGYWLSLEEPKRANGE